MVSFYLAEYELCHEKTYPCKVIKRKYKPYNQATSGSFKDSQPQHPIKYNSQLSILIWDREIRKKKTASHRMYEKKGKNSFTME